MSFDLELAKKSFDVASEAVKQLITLSTAILTLTIAFAKDIIGYAKVQTWPFAVSWICYLLSIISGLLYLLAMAALIHEAVGLEEANRAATFNIFRKNIVLTASLRLIFFILATLFIIYISFYTIAGSGTTPPRAG
jgi:hypothetical protein